MKKKDKMKKYLWNGIANKAVHVFTALFIGIGIYHYQINEPEVGLPMVLVGVGIGAINLGYSLYKASK